MKKVMKIIRNDVKRKEDEKREEGEDGCECVKMN